MLATSYEHAQRHDKALGVLCHMERSANHLARPVILRRIAFAHFRLKQFDLAEQALGTVLDLRPTDAGAERLLAVVQEAKGAGSAAKADELIAAVGELADYSGGLSPLAEMMLKECSLEGVAPNKVESGNFVLRDALALIDLARALGTKRPGSEPLTTCRRPPFFGSCKIRVKESRRMKASRIASGVACGFSFNRWGMQHGRKKNISILCALILLNLWLYRMSFLRAIASPCVTISFPMRVRRCKIHFLDYHSIRRRP